MEDRWETDEFTLNTVEWSTTNFTFSVEIARDAENVKVPENGIRRKPENLQPKFVDASELLS